MFESTVLWVCMAVLVVAWLWKWWQKPHPKFPPGPRGFPLLGVLPLVGKYPERVFKKWSMGRYGPVMSVKFGMEDVVVLNTNEAIHQALVKQGADFSGRPRIKLYTQVLGDDGLLFNDYNRKAKTQKKFALDALKNFGMGKKQMETIINDELDYFMQFLNTQVGKPQYFGFHFHNVIGNVICKLTFGRRFDYDDKTFRKMFDVLKETYSDPTDSYKIAMLLFFYDSIRNIPPFSSTNKRIIQSEHDIMSCVRPLIEEHRRTFDENQIRDYIDAFLYEQKHGKDPGFSDRQLEIAVRDIFAAGTETTSTTTSWFLLALLLHPEHKKKIQNEIDSVYGPKEWPSISKKHKTPFTNAFLHEVLRYVPTVPLSVTHHTQKDVELYGYVIPKGTTVIPNIWGAHFDPEMWKNPYEFNPYRHLDDEGNFVASSKVITFGIGPRFCLGESLARTELYLVLTRLLQKFDIKSTGGPLPSLLSGLTTIVHHPEKHHLILENRED